MICTDLSEGVSCRVFLGGVVIFESSSRWLHPLFELDEYLKKHCEIDPGDLFLADRIIGRAAALFFLHLRICRCAAPVVSERALPVLNAAGIDVEYEKTVPRLDCQTEDILAEESDGDRAWQLLKERARRFS